MIIGIKGGMTMNKRLFTILAFALIGGVLVFSCAKNIEEEAPEQQRPQPSGDFASVEAYIVQPTKAGETKTDYTLDDSHAYFHWVDDLDHIDVTVTKGTTLSSVAFTKKADEGEHTNFFLDGQISGQATLKDMDGYSLSDWAFYPSRLSPEAQEGDFRADWSYIDNVFKMDLPVSMRFPTAKPLAVVPMLGKRDADGKYAFDQMTGVLAVPVNNIPDDADFISITSEDVALAGCFTLTEAGGVKYIAARAPANDTEKTLTLRFSGLSGDQTFYFPVAVGTIPAGLVLTIGNSAKPEDCMVKTNKKPTVITRGNIVKTPALTYTPVDPQWENFGTGTFKDDFLWGQLGWTNPVAVTIQRSGLHSDKYRIANPYQTACTEFGYTPYNGGTPDQYFQFTLDTEQHVTFDNIRTGVEDKTSGGKPMMATYRSSQASHTFVESTLPDGTVTEIVFAAFYVDPDNSGYYYTKDNFDGNPKIHLTIDDNSPESWTFLKQGTYKDSFMVGILWGNSANASVTVPVDVYQSSKNAKRFRIANPYPALAAAVSYDIPEQYTTAPDEYLYITVADDGSAFFEELRPGAGYSGHELAICHPTTWNTTGTADTKDTSHNMQLGAIPSGLPAAIQLAPMYHEVGNYLKYGETGNYHFSRDSYDSVIVLRLYDDESWESIGTGRFYDEFLWNHNGFPPFAVPVEIFHSTYYPNNYRIPNPYTVANTAFRRTGKEGGDEYLYFTVNLTNGAVTFDTFVTGMTKGTSTLEDKNFAIAYPTVWNTLKELTGDNALKTNGVKVNRGTWDNPQEILFTGAYYDADDNTYFYTNGVGSSHLRFPAFFAAETWTDYSTGTYKDVTYDSAINGNDAMGTVEVTIQQSDFDQYRFRIANPYREHVNASYLRSTYDEYLYFNTCWWNDLVYFDIFRPGVRMNYDEKELAMNHPAATNLTSSPNYGGSDFTGTSQMSKTVSRPRKVQLGAHYYNAVGPEYSYCYTRQGSSWPDDRIYIGFDISDKVEVTYAQVPIMANAHVPAAWLSMPAGTLDKLVVKVSGIDPAKLKGLRIYGPNGWMDGSNSDYVPLDGDGVVTFTNLGSFTGRLDLNLWLNEDPAGSYIGSSIKFDVQEVTVSGVDLAVVQDKNLAQHPGFILNTGSGSIDKGIPDTGYNSFSRRGFDELIASFRIPAFVTTKAGSLIAAYDIRYDNSADLQGDIDVGFRRSTDGGKTWSPLGIAMDMGTYGYADGLIPGSDDWKTAQRNNGIGDPCLLVDETTGRIYCFGLWAHGHYSGGDRRVLWWSQFGYDIETSGQFIMVYSDDDGQTWSEPVNITRQLKKNDWQVIFQGPGRGITLHDGTLVIPVQHQEGSERVMHGTYPLNAGIAYSTDHGQTWHTHNAAYPITGESSIVELTDGKLLLSMREETDSHVRRNYYTTDLGRTWIKHASDGKLIDSTCEASMITVPASKNVTGKDLVIFSNPHNAGGRSRMTIQISEDNAQTWPYSLLIDAGGSLGYSCLSMVDSQTIGIVYECSKGNIVFQAIPLMDIVN